MDPLDVSKLQEYRSHKVVRACKIKSVKLKPGGSAIITPSKGKKFAVSHLYVKKHNPIAGGYFVVYEDGYQSWSPGDVFDAGNTKVTADKDEKKGKADDKEHLAAKKAAFIAKIAETCHEVNRTYCQSIGDNSQLTWEKAPDWQKESAVKGVIFRLENPKAGPDSLHNNWMKDKVDEGWKYGEEKDPEKKLHPCIVPYADLPESQRYKDDLFIAVVKSLSAD